MAAPISATNTRGQSMDSAYDTSGVKKIKLAVGNVDVGLDEDAAWQAVATHSDDDVFGVNDGIVVVGGVDSVDGVTPRRAVVDSAGKFLVAPTPAVGAFTDRSGTIATGGAAQQIAAANTSRKYLLIQNVDTTEDLWVNFGVAAVANQPSIRLSPYGSLVLEGAFVTTQYVSVIAATTSHPYTAKEA